MIVDPNKLKLPETDIPSALETDIPSTPTPDRKKSRWKKFLLIILAIHLVFTVFDACVFHGPGASWLIRATGPGRLAVENTEYRVRPRQNEIVVTWTESVKRGRSHWGKGEKHSRTIPLDPMPSELARCYVDVTVDPDAPEMIPMMHFNADEIAPMTFFSEENVIGTVPEEITMDQMSHLPPEMVFRMKVRPEDVSALSEQFYLCFQKGGTIMLPYSKAGNGRRVMLMATNGHGPRPFYDEIRWEAEARPHKMPSRVGGMLQRIVLMPFAVIPDYVLDILFILFNMWWAAQFK